MYTRKTVPNRHYSFYSFDNPILFNMVMPQQLGSVMKDMILSCLDPHYIGKWIGLSFLPHPTATIIVHKFPYTKAGLIL